MIGIYLLFFVSFLFLGEWISRLRFCNDSPKDSSAIHANQAHLDSSANPTKSIKYIFATIATIFCALPIFFVLWDYYSLANLFYSLFGGISIFSALLMARFIANCIMCDFGKSAQRFAKSTKLTRFAQKFTFSPNPTNPRAFLVIFTFALVLYLGHLDLVAVDIFSGGRVVVALFVGAFIIALYFADKITGILALGAFIIALIFMGDSNRVIFALFDGYLLLYSLIFSVVWGFRRILCKG